MHKRLLVGLLGVVLAAASMFPVIKTDAARAPQPSGGVPTSQARVKPAQFPNYDIRLDGRGEFTDSDLHSTAVRQNVAQGKSAERAARASAVDNFRANLGSDTAQKLRAVVNETGAMKNFFIEGAPLSEAQSDTADNIARNFLKSQASLFALSDAGVNELKLNKEDND